MYTYINIHAYQFTNQKDVFPLHAYGIKTYEHGPASQELTGALHALRALPGGDRLCDL